MKNIILFDPEHRDRLLPLVYTRPVSELRVGILTISEKWARMMDGKVSYITQEYLNDAYPIAIETVNYIINGSILPNEELCKRIENLQDNQAILKDGDFVAARINQKELYRLVEENDTKEIDGFEMADVEFEEIRNVWDIITLNDSSLRADFDLLTRDRVSAPLNNSNRVSGDVKNIFLESGAIVNHSILNAEAGPIYIGKGAEVMEGCTIRGAFALGTKSVLKMGSKIYGAVSIGPGSKMGGEIKSVVVWGNSNKAHEGFLGDSVVGEWCNFGADSNTSNLKNNYDNVKLWDYTSQSMVKTDLQFLGLIMGDHSKCGINTMFNTGTVVGVSCNIFGSGYPPNFVPSFSWGGSEGLTNYDFYKACETINRVYERRNKTLSASDGAILKYVFNYSAKFRELINNYELQMK